MCNDEYCYEQFVNSTFDECIEIMMFNSGPLMQPYKKINEQKKDEEQLKQQKIILNTYLCLFKTEKKLEDNNFIVLLLVIVEVLPIFQS